MGWGREARRLRDPDQPLEHRLRALQTLVSEHHRPYGYNGTLEHLEHVAGVRRGFWGGRPRWTPEQLEVALAELERSRDSHLAYRAAFAERRRAEKATGRRVPTAGDAAALRRPDWIRDPAEAAVRVPSRRDRRPTRP